MPNVVEGAAPVVW